MNNSTARKAHEKKLSSIFRQLRLISTDVILCYGNTRNSLREDIRNADHVCELSEEYAFRALCSWLVTTSGSSVYSEAIRADLERVANCLSVVLGETGAYPFASDLSDEVFAAVLDRSKTLLNGCSPSVEMIGSLYEHIHKFPLHFDAHGDFDIPTHIQEKDKRRLVGQFYTPAHIVDYCFERALGVEKDKFIIALKSAIAACADGLNKPDLGESSFFPKILDPSCGTGNFLLGAIRFIRKHCAEVSPNQLMTMISSCLFGFELDGRSASLTRVAILIALAESWTKLPDAKMKSAMTKVLTKLRTNIKNTDTLYEAPDLFDGNSHQFQIVITNPPYVSFGARNQPTLIGSATKYFRTKYPDSAEYKIRIHSIFQDIALRYTAPGGVASLLIPDGFLTGGYYRKLRQLLLRKSKLRSFAELPADTVPGAVVGRWCVASYERSSESSVDSDYQVDLYSHIEPESLSYTLPKSLLVAKDQHRFRLVFNRIDQQLCELIDQLEPLSTQFQGRTGIRALNGQSSIVSDRQHGERWRRGITSGASVLPHVVTWKNDWLNIDAALLYKGGFDANVIENPKILIRQTGDCLIAAFDSDGLYHLNNVHSLSNRAGSTLSLHFIDGLLNSRFWLYLYRLKTREQGRALAQIDIETLESMPLPKPNASIENDIASLTQLYRKMEVASDRDMQRRIELAIDKLVYDIYVLDETIVQQIERCCGKLINITSGSPSDSELLTLQKLAESEEVVCRS
ncbi:MAG: N-6 DNA methylase [Cyanobacteria bacterium SZAS-4]|nr:N-6 DNA methylase [Cyanobacteria bacterium SZAS-4]